MAPGLAAGVAGAEGPAEAEGPAGVPGVRALPWAWPPGRLLAELGEDGVRGGAAHPVDPVVQHHHPLLVVREGLLRVLDDERGVQPAVLLHTGVRMEPVRPRVRDREPVRERAARGDVPLGQPGDAVHVVAQREAVPVHGGGLGEVVGQGEGEGAMRR